MNGNPSQPLILAYAGRLIRLLQRKLQADMAASALSYVGLTGCDSSPPTSPPPSTPDAFDGGRGR